MKRERNKSRCFVVQRWSQESFWSHPLTFCEMPNSLAIFLASLSCSLSISMPKKSSSKVGSVVIGTELAVSFFAAGKNSRGFDCFAEKV